MQSCPEAPVLAGIAAGRAVLTRRTQLGPRTSAVVKPQVALCTKESAWRQQGRERDSPAWGRGLAGKPSPASRADECGSQPSPVRDRRVQVALLSDLKPCAGFHDGGPALPAHRAFPEVSVSVTRDRPPLYRADGREGLWRRRPVVRIRESSLGCMR